MISKSKGCAKNLRRTPMALAWLRYRLALTSSAMMNSLIWSTQSSSTKAPPHTMTSRTSKTSTSSASQLSKSVLTRQVVSRFRGSEECRRLIDWKVSRGSERMNIRHWHLSSRKVKLMPRFAWSFSLLATFNVSVLPNLMKLSSLVRVFKRTLTLCRPWLETSGDGWWPVMRGCCMPASSKS